MVAPSAAQRGGEISGADLEGEHEKPKYDIYELGKSLEKMTDEILRHMNYKTDMRQKLEDEKTHTKHEIDIVAKRGSRITAVECKNYGEGSVVGMEDVRNFRQKLTDLKITSGIFVTNVRYSSNVENYAQGNTITLWDGQELREKFFSMTIGRLPANEAAKLELALPSTVDFKAATVLQLANIGSAKVSQARLVFHPYYRVHYKLKAIRYDPVKDKHVVDDEGTYVVDGLDGEIINQEESAVKKLGSLFKKAEEREERKTDKMVTEDVLGLNAEENMTLEQTTDYGISRIRPEVKEKTVLKAVVDRVIAKNITDESYEVLVGRGKDRETEKREFKIVPKADEVSIRKSSVVYVPFWDVEFEAGQRVYSRRILSSSGRTVKDEIALCPKHFSLGGMQLVKKQTQAVCEVCGSAFCSDHITQVPDGMYYCEEDLPEQYRPKEPEKKGFGFKLPFGKQFQGTGSLDTLARARTPSDQIPWTRWLICAQAA